MHALAQSCPTLCSPMDYSLPGSSVHGIFQTRIWKWVASSSSRGSSQPRDWAYTSWVSCTGSWILYHCITWEAPMSKLGRDKSLLIWPVRQWRIQLLPRLSYVHLWYLSPFSNTPPSHQPQGLCTCSSIYLQLSSLALHIVNSPGLFIPGQCHSFREILPASQDKVLLPSGGSPGPHTTPPCLLCPKGLRSQQAWQFPDTYKISVWLGYSGQEGSVGQRGKLARPGNA